VAAADELRATVAHSRQVRAELVATMTPEEVTEADEASDALLDDRQRQLDRGLGRQGDVSGSATLIWRFRAEQRDPDRADRAEQRAGFVVGGALAAVAVFLATDAICALAAGSAPGRSVSALVSAAVAAVVLSPLGLVKYRIGIALRSPALKGDGTLSAIGAGLGILALLGLLADRLLGCGGPTESPLWLLPLLPRPRSTGLAPAVSTLDE
jgi:hypothetical protein